MHGEIVVGLDIGTTKVCCFVAERDGGDRIRVTGIGHHVSEGLKAGNIVDMQTAEQSVLAAVHAAEQMAGTTIREVVVNVSSGAGALTDMGSHLPAYRVSKVSLSALTRMWAAELPGVLVNAVCPGWVATDMGGAGGRPVSDGAAGIVWAATLPDDGPTGGFFRDTQPIPW